MRVYFDTNVLVAAVLANHPHYPAARSALKHVHARKTEGWIGTHAAAEFYAVLTRLPLAPPVYPAEAWRILDRDILPQFNLVALSAQDYRNTCACARLQAGWARRSTTHFTSPPQGRHGAKESIPSICGTSAKWPPISPTASAPHEGPENGVIALIVTESQTSIGVCNLQIVVDDQRIALVRLHHGGDDVPLRVFPLRARMFRTETPRQAVVESERAGCGRRQVRERVPQLMSIQLSTGPTLCVGYRGGSSGSQASMTTASRSSLAIRRRKSSRRLRRRLGDRDVHGYEVAPCAAHAAGPADIKNAGRRMAASSRVTRPSPRSR